MINKIRIFSVFATLAVNPLIATTSIYASDISNTKQRMYAARTQDDAKKLYESIDREFGGDTTKIVEFLRKNGFSCQQGTVLFKVKCVFAYCGDRPLIPLLFQEELMSIGVIINKGGNSASVVHHQTECPRTALLLKEKQEYFLTGGTSSGR